MRPALLRMALAAAPPAAVERLASADRSALERALAGVERTPVPPGGSYLGELGRSLQQYLLGLITRASLPRVSSEALLAVLAVLAAVVVFLVLRVLLRRTRSRSREETAAGAVAALADPPAERDAAAWRAVLERCLAEGRVAEALEAAWWWLARSLAGSRAEPDWTSRDLVLHAGRRDLLDLVRRLDALAYGPRRPAAGEVRSLVDRLEAALS